MLNLHPDDPGLDYGLVLGVFTNPKWPPAFLRKVFILAFPNSGKKTYQLHLHLYDIFSLLFCHLTTVKVDFIEFLGFINI